MASGMSGQQFCFKGYLPYKKGELERSLRQLEQDSKVRKETQIFIEAPYRNKNVMDTAVKVLKGDINIFLESDEDLTKMSLKISYFETCINYIENILKMINNRGFQVKNAIDAKRYEFPV